MEDQIFGAHDEDGDLPLHKAALNGNPTALEWVIETWKKSGIKLDIDEMDQNGRSALFLVCYKGYAGAEGIVSRTPETQKKRLACARILIKEGADVNFTTPKIGMTPMHWAAYQSDNEMVNMLLKQGARLVKTRLGDTPVDVAGYCGNEDTVLVFLQDLERRIRSRSIIEQSNQLE